MRFLFLIFLTIFVLQNPCTTQDIPYQSHSFNDLNYIIQQLIKGFHRRQFLLILTIIGVDSFKIDINTATYDSCINYSTWVESNSDCFDDQYDHQVFSNFTTSFLVLF